MTRVKAYEFQVVTDGQTEWTQLQGNGGPMGNGLLFAGAPTGPTVEGRLLRQAQSRLEHAGSLVRLTDVDFPIAARLQSFKPDAVVACRPVYQAARKAVA